MDWATLAAALMATKLSSTSTAASVVAAAVAKVVKVAVAKAAKMVVVLAVTRRPAPAPAQEQHRHQRQQRCRRWKTSGCGDGRRTLCCCATAPPPERGMRAPLPRVLVRAALSKSRSRSSCTARLLRWTVPRPRAPGLGSMEGHRRRRHLWCFPRQLPPAQGHRHHHHLRRRHRCQARGRYRRRRRRNGPRATARGLSKRRGRGCWEGQPYLPGRSSHPCWSASLSRQTKTSTSRPWRRLSSQLSSRQLATTTRCHRGYVAVDGCLRLVRVY